MTASNIYVRTKAGAAALKSDSVKLPHKLRTLLVLIDGKVSLSELMRQAARLGITEDNMEELERIGFIERVAGTELPAAEPLLQQPDAAQPVAVTAPDMDVNDRFDAAQKFMRDTMADAVGIRSYFFMLKLEQTSSIADLEKLMDAYAKAISKASGVMAAETLMQKLRSLLGQS